MCNMELLDDLCLISGCYITKYPRLGGLQMQKLISHSSGGQRDQEIKALIDSVSGENLFPHAYIGDCLLAVPIHGRRNKETVWGLLFKALIPFMRTLPSRPNHLQKVAPPNTITSGIRCQHINYLGKQTFNLWHPAIPFLGIYSSYIKYICLHKNLYTSVHSRTIHNSQEVQTTQISIT